MNFLLVTYKFTKLQKLILDVWTRQNAFRIGPILQRQSIDWYSWILPGQGMSMSVVLMLLSIGSWKMKLDEVICHKSPVFSYRKVI